MSIFWEVFKQKNEYLLGYEDFVKKNCGGGGGNHNTGLVLGVITMRFGPDPILNLGSVILGSFLKVNVQKGDSF